MKERPKVAICDILHPNRLTAVVDVGASALDGDAPYRPMLTQGLCTVIGFEPQTGLWPLPIPTGLRMFADAIGDGSPATLRLCTAPGMASLFVPDLRSLRCFAGFDRWGQVLHERPIATRRLDDIEQVEQVDFLKVDAQGSELAVIAGAVNKLAEASVVQAEVSFVPLYEEQPMFRDVDAALAQLGFVFHTFVDVSHRMIVPYPLAGPHRAGNQVQSADAVYVRDFRELGKMSIDGLKQLALIAHVCFRSFDLAYRCLEALIDRGAIEMDAGDIYLCETGAA